MLGTVLDQHCIDCTMYNNIRNQKHRHQIYRSIINYGTCSDEGTRIAKIKIVHFNDISWQRMNVPTDRIDDKLSLSHTFDVVPFITKSMYNTNLKPKPKLLY